MDCPKGTEPRLYKDTPKRANPNQALAGLTNRAALAIVQGCYCPADETYRASKLLETAMTKRQKDWAMDHDWSTSFVMIGRNYYGQDLYLITCRDGERFTDYAELRAWAGY